MESTAPDIAKAKHGIEEYVGEVGVLLFAGSAVMEQLAMTGVGLGVAEHSTTLTRPVDRLRTTLSYIYVMAWGTPEEQKQITRMVNKMHRGVQSEGRYSAYDPELQLWVAATLARNGERIYELMFGQMDPATRERCYREGWVYGTALQVKDEMWPQTRADFDIYWDDVMSRLEPDPTIQDYARRLLEYRWWDLALRHQSLMTRGNLDPSVREVLALPWSERDQKRYDLFWTVFTPVYRRVPRLLRQFPARLVMQDMRRRLRAGKRVI